MRERNGVRIGQQVRDLDGTSLGRVVRLFDEGFQVRRGLPILFRRDFVVRYEELRGVRDGALVVARSSRDLLDFAAGGLPPSWRIPAPPGFPTAATPPEARYVREELARGRVGGAAPPERPATTEPVTDDEVREHVATRGETIAPPGDERLH
jgi:hypothetical protein